MAIPEPNYSLSELNRNVRLCLECGLPGSYWVRAETSEVRRNASGHCYLELIEKGNNDQVVARMRATIWANLYASLADEFFDVTGARFTSGMSVMVLVKVSFHELFGMSLNILDIDPAYSLGEMARQRQACIERLKKEGLMARNKLLEAVRPVQRVAIISSPSAAGYQDFMQHLLHNSFGVKIYSALFCATMQGRDTAPAILSALARIEQVRHAFDAVVIIRGGGAVAELQAFDEYSLAAGVAKCSLPVLTGIGHERDVSVLDMVAYQSFKTPTAVADFLVDGMVECLSEVMMCNDRLKQAGRLLLAAREQELARCLYKLPLAARARIAHEDKRRRDQVHRLNRAVNASVSKRMSKLDMYALQLKAAAQLQVDRRQEQLSRHIARLPWVVEQVRKRAHEQLKIQEQAVKLLDPKNILNRGFSVVRQQGHAVMDAAAIDPKQPLEITFAQGRAQAHIDVNTSPSTQD